MSCCPSHTAFQLTIVEEGSKKVGAVHLKGQDPLPADVILMATGVGPATDFLKESGFNLEKDGGVAVDENLRVKGMKNVYAIGDIAHYLQFPDKFQRRVEHWNVAGNMVSRLCLLKDSAYQQGTSGRS